MEKLDDPPPKNTESVEEVNKKLKENLDLASYAPSS